MNNPKYKIDEIILVFIVLVIIIGISVQEKGRQPQKADPEKILSLVLTRFSDLPITKIETYATKGPVLKFSVGDIDNCFFRIA